MNTCDMGQNMEISGWLSLRLNNEKRYSDILLEHLIFSSKNPRFNVFSVYDAIASLEGNSSNACGTKKADKFRGKLLRGLWKKHIFQAGDIPRNIRNHWKQEKVFETLNSRFPNGVSVNELAHYLTVEMYEQRTRQRKLTGEWLIYAPHEGKNYYLALGKHDDEDSRIRESVNKCIQEFPFLSEILLRS